MEQQILNMFERYCKGTVTPEAVTSLIFRYSGKLDRLSQACLKHLEGNPYNSYAAYWHLLCRPGARRQTVSEYARIALREKLSLVRPKFLREHYSGTGSPTCCFFGTPFSGVQELFLAVSQSPFFLPPLVDSISTLALKRCDWNFYTNFFPRCDSPFVTGECSHCYFQSPFAASRMPSTVFCVLVVRDPVRVVLDHVGSQGLKSELWRTVNSINVFLEEYGHEGFCRRVSQGRVPLLWNILSLGFYDIYLRTWQETAPEVPLMVVAYEDMTSFPQQTLQKVLAHVGLEDASVMLEMEDRRGLLKDQTKLLSRFYRRSSETFSNMVGRQMPWLSTTALVQNDSSD